MIDDDLQLADKMLANPEFMAVYGQGSEVAALIAALEATSVDHGRPITFQIRARDKLPSGKWKHDPIIRTHRNTPPDGGCKGPQINRGKGKHRDRY